MQDVYLELNLGRKSDYFISQWDIESYKKKFPYYKLYYDNKGYRISQNGPLLIFDLDDFENVINNNKRVWYISSADFAGRKYEYISNFDIESKIKQLEEPVFMGKNNNSKLYFFGKE